MQRLLIIGPAWIGDMVMSQSLFALLRHRLPDAVIDVVGPPWSVPLVERMPEIRRAIPLAVAHGEIALKRRWELGRLLAKENYTQAIVLPRSFKSALVPWVARVPLRTGFGGELRSLVLNDVRKLDRATLDQTVKRFIALGVLPDEPLPVAVPPRLRVDENNRSAVLERLRLGSRPAIALMPGAAYGPAKQWPVERFAELALSLNGRGYEVWVLGSAAERELGAAIGGAGPDVHNLCGETALSDTVDLLSMARAAVTNDSGLMHVAAASGTAVVAVYGSSSPALTPPLTSRRAILYLGLECSPCFARECPLGHLNCLRGITPYEVLAAIEGLIGAK